MKYLPTIAGALLGLLFVVFGLDFFLHFMPAQPMPPEGSPPALFMGALHPTGYLAFVKVLEILGGALTAIPRTRAAGLLILGPIIVNILAFQIFLLKGAALFSPPIVPVIGVLALYLVWSHRAGFCALLGGPGCCTPSK